jgi:hypothetical protein
MTNKHLSKRSKAVGGAASVGDNVDVRLVFLLVDTNNKHGGVLAGSRNDDLLSTTLQNASTEKRKTQSTTNLALSLEHLKQILPSSEPQPCPCR